MRFSEWKQADGLIYVATRGPSDGNGGITAIGAALRRIMPNTTFVHKGKCGETPSVVVTEDGHTEPDVVSGLLDQTLVDKARWMSTAFKWFAYHGDCKSVAMHGEMSTYWGSKDDPAVNEVARSALRNSWILATQHYEEGSEAMQVVNATMSDVVLKQFRRRPRPILVNDADNCLVPRLLIEKEPATAEWILYMHHIPVPHKIPPFYLEYLQADWEGILGGGIRFVGLHTPHDRKHFGQVAEEHLGGEYSFDESVMQLTHASGRITRLGQTLAGVDAEFFHAHGQAPLDMAELTGCSWMKGMKFVSKTDRMDDPMKNGRRFVQTVDTFFNDHPGFLGKIAFMVIGMPSRQGIAKYDDYLANCSQLIDAVNAKHSLASGWQPIVWLKKVVSPSVIAQVYGHPDCQGNFVGSKKDGLHLGALEFPEANWWKVNTPEAPAPGVLWLSDGTGAYTFLGHRGAIFINSRNVSQMARALYLGLMMSDAEKRFRAEQLLAATAQFELHSQMERILQQAGLPLPEASVIDQHTLASPAHASHKASGNGHLA